MKFRSILYGVGKAGNIVGRKGKGGEFIIAAYQPQVANPNTQAQQIVRAKAKLITQTFGPMSPWAKIFVKPSGKRTYWSELVKLNLDEAVTGTFPSFEVDFSAAVLANGSLELPFNAQATLDSNTLSLTWADNSGMGSASATDTVNVLMYDKTKKTVVFETNAATRSTRTASVTVPTAWNSDSIEVWMAMRSESGEISKSQYLGTFTV